MSGKWKREANTAPNIGRLTSPNRGLTIKVGETGFELPALSLELGFEATYSA